MKAAHFTDLHYCEKHLAWVHKAFSAGVEHAIAAGAKVAILSGDSFDKEILLHHPAVGMLVENVCRLAQHMPVFMLQGTFSHDRPGCLDIFRRLRARHPIYVADKPGQVALAINGWEACDSGDAFSELDAANLHLLSPKLVISALPSVNRADIQADSPDAKTSDVLAQLFDRWAAPNATIRQLGFPTVLVSHGTVNGCVTESRQAMVSPDHEFGTAALFSAQTSAVMLGHIHAHQGWEYGGRRIAYGGSITKLIYGHEQPTGYLLWDVRADGADYEFIPLPARKMIDVDFDGPPDLAALQARAAEFVDAYVRVSYSIDEEHRHAVDIGAIKDLLKAAGAADYKLDGHINPVQRTRAAGISRAASIEERLLRWCELTNSEPAPLVERLRILQSTARD